MARPCVYAGSSCDVKDAAHTIVQAFLDDPFNAYFYNLKGHDVQVQGYPAPGTEEMMAIHIGNLLLTEMVLLADDGDRKCAGVALWEPPRSEPLGWWTWSVKQIYSAYEAMMGLVYYRHRGINRQVFLSSVQLISEIPRVSKGASRGDATRTG